MTGYEFVSLVLDGMQVGILMFLVYVVAFDD